MNWIISTSQRLEFSILNRVQTPLWMSVTYISSQSFDVRKEIISELDIVIPYQEFHVPDFLIFA